MLEFKESVQLNLVISFTYKSKPRRINEIEYY